MKRSPSERHVAPSLPCVHIHLLFDHRNISVKLPCVAFTPRPLHFLGKNFLFLLLFFVKLPCVAFMPRPLYFLGKNFLFLFLFFVKLPCVAFTPRPLHFLSKNFLFLLLFFVIRTSILSLPSFN